MAARTADLPSMRKVGTSVRLRAGTGGVRDKDGRLIGLEATKASLSEMLHAVLTRSENQSALLVGPRGSGKSLVLREALCSLQEEMLRAHPGASTVASAAAAMGSLGHGLPFVTVHINGHAITDDQSAVREISAQLAIDPEAATAAATAERDSVRASASSSSSSSGPGTPVRRAGKRSRGSAAGTRVSRQTVAHACVRAHRQTFEQHLEYVVATLRDGRATDRPVVLVVDEFDVFCARTKQSLLYNLLDLTQDPSVRFAFVGVTSRLDVVDLLEKRLRSRFSHRQFLFAHPPREDYEAIFAAALTALPGRGLDRDAVAAFNEAADEAAADPAVIGCLRRWHSLGRPPRLVMDWVGVAVARACGPGGDGRLTPALLTGAAASCSDDPLVGELSDASPLEASLLGAMAHLETRAGDDGEAGTYNFEMAFREYEGFTRAQGAGTLAVERAVALKAFESMVRRGLVVVPAVTPETSAAARSAAHMSRHSQLVRLGVEPCKLLEAVREGDLSLPTALRHWILHGDQT